MTRKSLLVTRKLPEATEAALAARFEATFRGEAPGLTPAEAREALAGHDAVLCTLGDRFSAEAFEGAPRAGMLANYGAGVNHIDVAAARAAGLQVSNTPGAVTEATADIAVMLMLMAARRASEGEALLRSGAWTGWTPTQLLGMHVSGKTLGVVGMGRIGKAVARRAHHGFGMEVVFFNRSRVGDAGVPARQLDTLPEVMGAADVVVIALPATPQTRHRIDAAALAAMQPHAVIVNVARGDIIDEAALIAALREGRIAGAGLDVFEHEPEVPEELRRMANVSLTPHMGTSALEVREGMGQMAIDNLLAWDEGRDLPNPVG